MRSTDRMQLGQLAFSHILGKPVYPTINIFLMLFLEAAEKSGTVGMGAHDLSI